MLLRLQSRLETSPFRRLRCHILDAAHPKQAADLTACKAWVLSRCDDPADRLDDTGGHIGCRVLAMRGPSHEK